MSTAPRSSRAEAVSPKLFPLWGREAEVFVGARGRDAAARRPIQESGLDQKRFVNVLQRVAFLAERGGQAGHADGTALELVDDRAQQPAIDFVEAVLVDFEHLQCLRGGVEGDVAV